MDWYTGNFEVTLYVPRGNDLRKVTVQIVAPSEEAARHAGTVIAKQLGIDVDEITVANQVQPEG